MQDFHEAALSARVARSQVLLPPTPRPKPRCGEADGAALTCCCENCAAGTAESRRGVALTPPARARRRSMALVQALSVCARLECERLQAKVRPRRALTPLAWRAQAPLHARSRSAGNPRPADRHPPRPAHPHRARRRRARRHRARRHRAHRHRAHRLRARRLLAPRHRRRLFCPDLPPRRRRPRPDHPPTPHIARARARCTRSYAAHVSLCRNPHIGSRDPASRIPDPAAPAAPALYEPHR